MLPLSFYKYIFLFIGLQNLDAQTSVVRLLLKLFNKKIGIHSVTTTTSSNSDNEEANTNTDRNMKKKHNRITP